MKKNLLILALMMATAFGGFSQKKNVTSAIMATKSSRTKQADYPKAKFYIDKAIKNESTSGQAKTWYYKAFIYANLGNSKDPKALEMQKTIDFDTEVLEAMKMAKKLDKKGEYQSKIIKLAAPMYDKSITSGVASYNDKKYDKALAYFTSSQNYAEILSIADSAGAYYGGLSADNLKNYEASIKNFSRCIEIEYGGADAYLRLVDAYKNAGKEEEAAKTLAAAKAKFPNDANITLSEAKKLLLENKPEEAQKSLEAALANDPNNSALQYAAGVAYNEMEEYDKAIAAYEKALEINPNDYNSKFNLAVVYNNKVVELNGILKEIPYQEKAKYEKALSERDAFINKVLPFVVATYEIEKEEAIKRVLNNFYRLTKQMDKMIK